MEHLNTNQEFGDEDGDKQTNRFIYEHIWRVMLSRSYTINQKQSLVLATKRLPLGSDILFQKCYVLCSVT